MSSPITPHRLDRIAALRAEAGGVRGLARSLTVQEWHTPSAAAGWRVQEVIAHMGAACHSMFTPWALKVIRGDDAEANNDRDAEYRRAWEPAKVLAEYERWSPRFVRTQASTAKLPAASKVKLRLAELGTFPLPLFASAFVFDRWTHLAHDIAPVLDRPAPVTDDNRMGVVIEWMLAGLEQMCRKSMIWLDQPVGLTLQGLGGGSWTVVPTGGGLLRVRPGDPDTAAAHIAARSDELPLWGTTRRPWRDCDITLHGDEELATRFLDSVDIV